MSMFKEVQETDKPIETEKQRLSTAFENNKKNEGSETRHLKTINEQYEGQKYPGTDVEYKHERIQVNGEKVEGVFPQFESKDVERLPRKMWESSDAQQFSFCTQMLGQKLEHNPALESRFTPSPTGADSQWRTKNFGPDMAPHGAPRCYAACEFKCT